MARAIQLTLFALAALVIAFVATWLTIPSNSLAKVNPPASLFVNGITESIGTGCIDFDPTGLPPPNGQRCVREVSRGNRVDIATLQQRVRLGYAGAAAVLVLVGLAIGAGRRSRATLTAASRKNLSR